MSSIPLDALGSVVRLDEDGGLGELVVQQCAFHLERMSGNGWWIGLYTEAGECIDIRIGGKSPNALVYARVEHESGANYYVEGRR